MRLFRFTVQLVWTSSIQCCRASHIHTAPWNDKWQDFHKVHLSLWPITLLVVYLSESPKVSRQSEFRCFITVWCGGDGGGVGWGLAFLHVVLRKYWSCGGESLNDSCSDLLRFLRWSSQLISGSFSTEKHQVWIFELEVPLIVPEWWRYKCWATIMVKIKRKECEGRECWRKKIL